MSDHVRACVCFSAYARARVCVCACVCVSPPDPEALGTCMSMGFEAKYAELALKETGGNIERAVEYLFSRTPEDMDALLTAAPAPAAPVCSPLAGRACVRVSRVYACV